MPEQVLKNVDKAITNAKGIGTVTYGPKFRRAGKLLIIGGHEDKEFEKRILREAARLIGAGKLVLATCGSQEPRVTWEEYEHLFRSLGVKHICHLNIKDRTDAASPRNLKVLKDAGGIFSRVGISCASPPSWAARSSLIAFRGFSIMVAS